MRWKVSIEGSDEITRGQKFEFELEKNFDNLIDRSVRLSIDDCKTILAWVPTAPRRAAVLNRPGFAGDLQPN